MKPCSGKQWPAFTQLIPHLSKAVSDPCMEVYSGLGDSRGPGSSPSEGQEGLGVCESREAGYAQANYYARCLLISFSRHSHGDCTGPVYSRIHRLVGTTVHVFRYRRGRSSTRSSTDPLATSWSAERGSAG